jgi:hypothetical protein
VSSVCSVCCVGHHAHLPSHCPPHRSLTSPHHTTRLLSYDTVVDRDVAWNQIKSITGFGSGGSKTNSLFWVASRTPSPPNYNSSIHMVDVKASMKSSCSANSACDAAGATGMCCPTEGTGLTPGVSLGCCPLLHS